MATSARNWKKPSNEELELPSGNVALVKRPGMESLLASGVMPDSLTPIILESIKQAQRGQPQDHKGKGGKATTPNELSPEQMEKLLSDPNALNDIFASFDRVCEMVVVEPAVKYHKVLEVDDNGNPRKDVDGKEVWTIIPHADRDPEILYTDDVDPDDKEFIFQFVVGGSRDLESFRQARSEGMGDLSVGEDVQGTSE